MPRKRPAIPAIPIVDPGLSSLLQAYREAVYLIYEELDEKASKTQLWEHTVIIEAPADGTYTILLKAGSKRKIRFVDAIAASGTGDLQVQIDGVPLEGTGDISVSSTIARHQYLHSNNVLLDKAVALVFSSVSSLGRTTVTLRGTYDLS